MPHQIVKPVVDLNVRKLCSESYYNHPKGCPNFGKPRCPPKCRTIGEIIDLNKLVFAVWNIFDFSQHCAKMRTKHPNWSLRQVECCLYWQPTARKQLKHNITRFKMRHNYSHWIIVGLNDKLGNPEGSGVNVTATMASIGHNLEWPPETKTYQVALAGFPIVLGGTK